MRADQGRPSIPQTNAAQSATAKVDSSKRRRRYRCYKGEPGSLLRKYVRKSEQMAALIYKAVGLPFESGGIAQAYLRLGPGEREQRKKQVVRLTLSAPKSTGG